jgi:F-type H+-transporting ATPase subunit b
MGISVDVTFAIQIVSFLILWAVLRRLLFDPMLDVLDQRNERTRGSLEAASHMRADVEAMRAEYDARVAAAREKSLADLEESRKLTTAEERTVLGAARDQAAGRLASARVEISKEIDAARGVLEGEAAALAGQLIEKVVGRRLA